MSINSNSTRSFALTARETVQVQGEGQRSGNRLARDSSKSVGARGAGSAANSFESRGEVQLRLVQLVLLVKVH
jgi:hypothetical protein